MASASLSLVVNNTLAYSDQYNFPLTPREIWFWQIATTFSQKQISSVSKSGFNYLPGRSKIVKTRVLRARYSLKKWSIARKVVKKLQTIPTIEAIFVTGALSMDNSPKHDDIDIMIVTVPNALWITRLLVVSYLSWKSLRRPLSLPEHASPRVSGKICDNLYLDTHNLNLTPNKLTSQAYGLYLAHEILQAKPVFDRNGIRQQLLLSNSWVKKYLPIAYKASMNESKKTTRSTNKSLWGIFLVPLNILCFVAQYLYMLPKKSSEKVGIGFAFFHPRAKIPPK